MKRSAVAAIALASTTALSGAALVPGAATTDSTMHTLKLVAHSTATHSVGKYDFVGADTDRHNGAVIGYDTFSGHFFVKQNKAILDVAAALKGGIILLHITQDGSSNAFTGTISGGRGKYVGIKGTVSGYSPSQNSAKTFVTLHYHF